MGYAITYTIVLHTNEQIIDINDNLLATPYLMYHDTDYGLFYTGNIDGSLSLVESVPGVPTQEQSLLWEDYRLSSSTFDATVTSGVGATVSNQSGKGVRITKQDNQWNAAAKIPSVAVTRASGQSVKFALDIEQPAGSHMIGLSSSTLDVESVSGDSCYHGACALKIVPNESSCYGNDVDPTAPANNWQQTFTSVTIPSNSFVVVEMTPDIANGFSKIKVSRVEPGNWDIEKEVLLDTVASAQPITNTNPAPELNGLWLPQDNENLGFHLAGVKVE